MGFLCQYAFDVAMISAFGKKLDPEVEGIKKLYQCLEKGYNSMPINLPGTLFHKAIKVYIIEIYHSHLSLSLSLDLSDLRLFFLSHVVALLWIYINYDFLVLVHVKQLKI